ncbi:unnamed protein product [[Candida] boidinii]|nr:unnamed protein product [[Candida] boidinii]
MPSSYISVPQQQQQQQQQQHHHHNTEGDHNFSGLSSFTAPDGSSFTQISLGGNHSGHNAAHHQSHLSLDGVSSALSGTNSLASSNSNVGNHHQESPLASGSTPSTSTKRPGLISRASSSSILHTTKKTGSFVNLGFLHKKTAK